MAERRDASKPFAMGRRHAPMPRKRIKQKASPPFPIGRRRQRDTFARRRTKNRQDSAAKN
jgi:hypothetical protein